MLKYALSSIINIKKVVYWCIPFALLIVALVISIYLSGALKYQENSIVIAISTRLSGDSENSYLFQLQEGCKIEMNNPTLPGVVCYKTGNTVGAAAECYKVGDKYIVSNRRHTLIYIIDGKSIENCSIDLFKEKISDKKPDFVFKWNESSMFRLLFYPSSWFRGGYTE